MYKLVQDKYKANPEIAASIVQKLAVRSNLKPSEVNQKLVMRYEYKNMLRSIQQNLDLIDNKMLVDTIYAVGRLHRETSFAQLNTEYPEFAKYYQYFIKDMLREVSTRIDDLSHMHIAYLSKGLTDLRKQLSLVNTDQEASLRELIKQHAIQNAMTYDPYSISKVCRYLYSYNDGDAASLQVYETLGHRFLGNLRDRLKSMELVPVDDPLIDIETNDIVDIVRVFSVFSKNQEKQLFVP